MPPVRKTSGDARAARMQLGTADQSARVAKESRAEEAGDELVLPLRDQEYRLGHTPSIMSLMEWGASSGGGSLVAAFHVLEDVVHPDDWDAFRTFCRENNVEAEEFGVFINAATEALAGRPTGDATG